LEVEWEFFIVDFLSYHSRRQPVSYSFVSFQCGFSGGGWGRTHHFVNVISMW